MWKLRKSLVQNIIVNFIPFIIMTVLALAFLWRSFVMLENRNLSSIRGQLQNIMGDVEKELLIVMEVADRISSDSLLSKRNLEKYGRSTLDGIEKIRLYEMQLPYSASAFVSYWPTRIISGTGTIRKENFLENELNLSNQGKETFHASFEAVNLNSSSILRKKDGNNYLMFLFYYPESLYVAEKRIGVLFETRYIEEEFGHYLQGMDGVLFLYWKGEMLGHLNCLADSLSQEELNAIYEKLERGEEIKGYRTMYLSADHVDFQIKVAISNDELRLELVGEMFKMAFIGGIAFVILSTFLWVYNHYRYVMMRSIKQFISMNHPEFEEDSVESDYVIIQKVLKKDLETLNRRDEDFNRFKREVKSQLAWLLLKSSPSEDFPIEEFMAGYGMEWEGPYCCVINFWLDSLEMPEWEDRKVDGVDVILSYETRFGDGVILMVCVNLQERDDEYIERSKIIDLMKRELLKQGFSCIKVGCGLVYDSLSEVHCSQQEAYTLIQESMSKDSDKDVLFFSKQAKMARRVPGITSELLKQFKDYVQERNRQEALRVFEALMALPEEMAGDLLLYVRYKIVSILVEIVRDMELDNDVILRIVDLGNQEGVMFRDAVYKVLEKVIPEEKGEKIEINAIIDFIESRYDDVNLNVDMISSHFGINERSVRRIMKKGLNKTYKEFLNEVRIKHACELLLQTDQTNQVISSQTGFFHANTFYRVFRQVMGMSPDEYRMAEKKL